LQGVSVLLSSALFPGQVDVVVADKTGTLTDNVMALRMLAVRGRVYGRVEEGGPQGGGPTLAQDAGLQADLRAAARLPPHPAAGPGGEGAGEGGFEEGEGGQWAEDESRRQLVQVLPWWKRGGEGAAALPSLSPSAALPLFRSAAVPLCCRAAMPPRCRGAVKGGCIAQRMQVRLEGATGGSAEALAATGSGSWGGVGRAWGMEGVGLVAAVAAVAAGRR
jgi:hypothetical protein